MTTATATATATACAPSPACCPATCPCPPEPKEMVFYYRVTQQQNPSESNGSEFTYVTNPDTFSGINTRYGMNADGSENRDILVTYNGSRIPADESLGLPAFFTETLLLNVKPIRDNFLQASAIYPDEGSGEITSVASNLFAVNAGIGIFKDAKTVLVEYNNVDKTRKLIVRNY
jgi:hypothetical protein